MGGTTQGWYIPLTGGGSTPLTSLTIQNTFYVAKNGDDLTALPNRLDKPFLTIYEASLVANAGDVIYVFSGTYDEGINDWVKSDVIYDFQSGTTVMNELTCITDGGISKNIRIQGNANFQQTGNDFSFGVINVTNSATNLFVRCNDLISNTNGILIFNTLNPYDIEVNDIYVSFQYAISLRGTSNTGYIKFNNIFSTSQLVSIFFRDCNTDGIIRSIYINGNFIITNQNSFSQGVIDMFNAFNTKVYCSIKNIKHYSGNNGGLIRGDSGKLFLYNFNGNGVGYGYQSTGTHVGFIQNSNIYAPTYALSISSSSSIFCKNSFFIGENLISTSGSVIVSSNGELTAKNCTIIQRGATINPCVINLLTPLKKVSLSSCVLIGNILNTESIRNTNGVATDIYIQEDCSSNLPVNILVTNQITGTNIVVDSDIIQNTNNFF